MKLDFMSGALELRDMQRLAPKVEAAGFGSMWLTESGRTAYLSCAAAGLATDTLGIGTAIAVAFPRSPMVTASTSWELAEATDGRFILGLGTQVKAHIERRYSSEYSHPGPRLREYVESVKAIFRAFRGEEKLHYEGDFYNFSLLPRQWSPGPIDQPDPKIFVSAVLPWMSRMAGEVCDGVHIHPFNSPDYIRRHQMPAIEEGLARSGRSLDDLTLVIPVMTAVGDTDEEIAATREHARLMVAFYGSTRTYSPVFETHGFEGLSDDLHSLQRSGDIAGMASAVTDEVLDNYIVSAGWSDLGDALVARYGSLGPDIRIVTYTATHQLITDPEVLDRWAHVADTVNRSDPRPAAS